MKQEFLDMLRRLAPTEQPERLDRTAVELDTLMQRMAAALQDLGDERVRQDIIAQFGARTLLFLLEGKADLQRTELSPELLDSARSQVSEEEVVAGLREIRATGGLELHDFIHELEQEAAPRD